MTPTHQGSFRLFRVAGIDVFLHWSWFIVAMYEISTRMAHYTSPFWNVAEYLTLFLIVLLHEFGHALACRQVGGTADTIVLLPLGGVAYVNPPQRPGATLWAIAEGYIPPGGTQGSRALDSHETACLLNAGEADAHVRITLFFRDREPAGPYPVTVPARRTLHLRFNDLRDPEPIPVATDYASVIESDVPIVVQHTRLDARQAESALLSTIAWASD